MCNNYSIDYCINNCEEFERVGFPELGRNEVFFDKKNKCYVKFYGIPSHFTNEKAALHYYKNFYLAPKLEFESETCLGIKSKISIYRITSTILRNIVSGIHFARN